MMMIHLLLFLFLIIRATGLVKFWNTQLFFVIKVI